eukprot:845498-Ditylum_brightwellii.AAC.1
MWCEGEEDQRAAGEQVNKHPAQMREQGHDKMREPQGTGFVDTNTLDLRRSTRTRKLNLKPTMAADSETPDLSIGSLSVALHTTTSIQYQLHQFTKHMMRQPDREDFKASMHKE